MAEKPGNDETLVSFCVSNERFLFTIVFIYSFCNDKNIYFLPFCAELLTYCQIIFTASWGVAGLIIMCVTGWAARGPDFALVMILVYLIY